LFAAQEMEKHPFFMTKMPEEGAELSPGVAGLNVFPIEFENC